MSHTFSLKAAARRWSRRLMHVEGVMILAATSVAFVPAGRALNVPGVSYSFLNTTVESDETYSTSGKSVMRSLGKVRVAGDRARIDFAEMKGGSPVPMLGEDGYVLIHDDGNTMYMVDTKDKKYLKMDPESMGSMMSSLSSMAGGMMKIEVKDPSMSVRQLGPGETIIGQATEKWELKQAYTMSVSSFGFGSTTTNESTSTLWMAPDMKAQDLMNPFLDMARNLGAMFGDNEEWQEVIMAPSRELPQVPALKVLTQQKVTTDKNKVQYSVTSMEVTEFKRGDVKSSDLDLPKGYTMIELPDMAALSDSMKAAGLDTLDLRGAMENAGFTEEDIGEALKQAAIEGAKMQAEIEAREAGKNAVKKGVGGLLKRKWPY